jgi:hypothetical protein
LSGAPQVIQFWMALSSAEPSSEPALESGMPFPQEAPLLARLQTMDEAVKEGSQILT